MCTKLKRYNCHKLEKCCTQQPFFWKVRGAFLPGTLQTQADADDMLIHAFHITTSYRWHSRWISAVQHPARREGDSDEKADCGGRSGCPGGSCSLPVTPAQRVRRLHAACPNPSLSALFSSLVFSWPTDLISRNNNGLQPTVWKQGQAGACSPRPPPGLWAVLLQPGGCCPLACPSPHCPLLSRHLLQTGPCAHLHLWPTLGKHDASA